MTRLKRLRLRVGAWLIGGDYLGTLARLWLIRDRAKAAVSPDGLVTLAARTARCLGCGRSPWNVTTTPGSSPPAQHPLEDVTMILEMRGLTRDEEMAWLMRQPWTFTSEPADDAGEFVVRVAEMPDALAIGTEKEVSHDIFASLRASLECRLDAGDLIPLPRLTAGPSWIRAAPTP